MFKTNKKTVKMVLVLALVFVLTACFFGCGKTVQNTGELPTGYVPEPAGKLKLQYCIATTDQDKTSVNDWVKAFKAKYPDVKVDTEFSAGAKAFNTAQISAKSVGDVFFFWETDVYDYAVNQKILMKLDHYLEPYNIDMNSVFSAIYNIGVVEGKLYMVERDYNHIALMYNRDAIVEQGLEDPIKLEREGTWDWDTFKSYCKDLTFDDGEEKQQVGAKLRLGYAPLYMAWLEGWGGKWYDTVHKKTFFRDDENVLKAVNEMVDFVKSNTVCYYNVDGNEAITETQSQRAFSGVTPVFYDTEYPNFAKGGMSYDEQGIDWDVVSMPAFPTHKVGVGCTGYGVYNGTKNPDAAAALCLSLYTEEGQRAYNGQSGGSVPNVKALAESDFWRVGWEDKTEDDDPSDPDKKNFNAWISFPEADTYGRVECVVPPQIAEIVVKAMNDIIPNVVNGQITAADALQQLQTQCNQKWDTIYTN